jgi:hypothetical protein
LHHPLHAIESPNRAAPCQGTACQLTGALASGDSQLTVDLVAQYAVPMCFQGHPNTAVRWFRALGEDVCAPTSRSVVRTTAAAATGQVSEMDRWAPTPNKPQTARSFLLDGLNPLVRGCA